MKGNTCPKLKKELFNSAAEEIRNKAEPHKIGAVLHMTAVKCQVHTGHLSPLQSPPQRQTDFQIRFGVRLLEALPVVTLLSLV